MYVKVFKLSVMLMYINLKYIKICKFEVSHNHSALIVFDVCHELAFGCEAGTWRSVLRRWDLQI